MVMMTVVINIVCIIVNVVGVAVVAVVVVAAVVVVGCCCCCCCCYYFCFRGEVGCIRPYRRKYVRPCQVKQVWTLKGLLQGAHESFSRDRGQHQKVRLHF